MRWFLSLRVEVPTVAGWLRPTILIPARCWSRLAVEQIEAYCGRDRAYPPARLSCQHVSGLVLKRCYSSIRRSGGSQNACAGAGELLRRSGGDDLWWRSVLVARALLALEEDRSAPVLRVAANGGSLRERIRHLVAPSSGAASPAEAGWAGVSMGVAAMGL